MDKHEQVVAATDMVTKLPKWNKAFNNRMVLNLMRLNEPLQTVQQIIRAAMRKKMSTDEVCRYVNVAIAAAAREGG